MALPKSKKKIHAQDEEKATFATSMVEQIRAEQQKPNKENDNPLSLASHEKKKMGRPIPYHRDARMTFLLKKSTLQKLNRIFPQVHEEYKDKGMSIDKSFLVEQALIEWLENKKL